MLNFSDIFSKLYPSLGLFSILIFKLHTKPVETITIGTAYAVWTGIGAVGTVFN